MIPDFKEDPFFTVGDQRLCAWRTSENSCRIQTNDPAIFAQLKKLQDLKVVGYSVRGAWIRICAMPYTLEWVAKHVVQKLTLQLPRKNEGSKTDSASGEVLKPKTI